MKTLILVLLFATPAIGQEINFTASDKHQTAELIFISGEQASLGIASGINNGNHAISASYHPFTFKNIQPYMRYRDGVSIQDKAYKMYGYDFGLKIGYLNISRNNTFISGYQSYSSWQFGVTMQF